jgi:predicted DsbA family dithiol-disulfide isomerase
LHPETPPEGQSLLDLFSDYPVDIDVMIAGLKRTATELGLPFGERTRTYNSRLAQELGLWAEEQGAGEAFHMAAFKAYFVEGQNIADTRFLAELASTTGLSDKAAEDVLTNRLFKVAVDEDWQAARELAITAVPTFLMNQDRLVGAQPYELLENLVTMHGAARRNQK